MYVWAITDWESRCFPPLFFRDAIDGKIKFSPIEAVVECRTVREGAETRRQYRARPFTREELTANLFDVW